MPLAGGFLRKEDIPNEKSYPLVVYFCNNCKLVQLLDIVPAEVLFKEYFYLSSTTKTLSKHFEDLAKKLRENFLNEDSFVVEIGSNDGVFLKPLKSLGIRSVGFEPATNIAKIARSYGLNVVNNFFTEKSAREVAQREGKADLVSASNVFAHIEDLQDVVRGVKAILKDDGIFVFEVHYLLDLIEKMQYDTIYHEHMFYHSIVALTNFFKSMDMEIFDVERIPIHEGSIRVFVKNVGDKKHNVRQSVHQLLATEKKSGLDNLQTLITFGENVRKHREVLVGLLKQIKRQGKRIVGYGAPGRGNTLLNYCKIDTNVLEYTTDESPTRQGRITPGTHIQIVSPERLRKEKPSYALMLAWSYMKEILEKEKDYVQQGGKFIVPLPIPKIIPQ
jgi:SAM-dependent methyltransferase